MTVLELVQCQLIALVIYALNIVLIDHLEKLAGIDHHATTFVQQTEGLVLQDLHLLVVQVKLYLWIAF